MAFLLQTYRRFYSICSHSYLHFTNFINYYLGYRVLHNHFPYDYNTPMPQGGEKVMERCCNALEAAGITYFLSSGTALAVYRDRKFLPHDPDIDIDIVGPVDILLIHSVFAEKLGMHLGLEITYKTKPQQIVYYTDETITFDMHFWYEKGRWAYNHSQRGYLWKHPYDFYKNLDTVEFLEKTYPVPHPIEKYLAYLYGKDWRTPQHKKSDFRENRHDIIKK